MFSATYVPLSTQHRARGLLVGHVRLGFCADHADCLSVALRVAELKAVGATVLGSWRCDFPAEVASLDGELVFTKPCVSPFFNTSLLVWLLPQGVTELVIGGVATPAPLRATPTGSVQQQPDPCNNATMNLHYFDGRDQTVLHFYAPTLSAQSSRSEFRSLPDDGDFGWA